MAKVKITLNHRGMAEILTCPGVTADVTARANRVLATAKASAPVDTGAYRDNLHVEVDQTSGPRVRARVMGGTDHDWIVEARTGNLRRALEAAGGEVS